MPITFPDRFGPLRRIPTRSAACMAILIALTCAGCITVYTQETFAKVGEQGVFASPADLARVRPGVTTRADLLEMFGAPARSSVSDSGGEVLTYEYLVRRTESRTVAPIKSTVRTTHRQLQVNYELKDGVVAAVHRESHALGAPEGPEGP